MISLLILSLYFFVISILFLSCTNNCPDKYNNIKVSKIILFEDIGLENFTCTGITYDQTDNCFWICDYGALNPEEFTYPKLVSIDTSITKKICEIDLSSCIGEGMHNIQGICFDKKTNCFYIADGNNIIVIDKTPILINQIDVSRYGIVANGICITEDDTLFVLGYNSFLLHLNKNGTLLEKKQFDFPNQNMLTIYNNYLYATVGADYEGDNNYLA